MKCSDFTIVVAEDDPGLLNIYKKSLSMEGYKLVLARTCERALADLYEEPADLIVADVKMEDMDGFEMLPLLLKNHPQLPVIMISGPYQTTIEDFHNKGFVNVKAFFQKPIKMDILNRKIQEILKIEGA
jgi:DNA-binding NtrC family response regulator